MKRPSAIGVVCLTCLCCLGWGCNEERSHRVAASYSSVTRPTHPSSVHQRTPVQAPVGLDAIPTEEDYEERAAANIAEANLVSKLTELEKEMAF